MQQCIEHGFVAVNTYRSFRSTSSIDATDNIQLTLHSWMVMCSSNHMYSLRQNRMVAKFVSVMLILTTVHEWIHACVFTHVHNKQQCPFSGHVHLLPGMILTQLILCVE